MARGWVYEDAGSAGAGWRVMVNADLPNSGVTAATYGDSTHVSQVTVNAQGIVTSASSVAVAGGAPSGAAGGDLGSTYPNPTVVAVEETSGPTRLALGAVTNGQYLLRSGSTITSGVPAGTSPLTTKGDLYGYSSANDRIPLGTDGQVLTADSSQSLGVKWGTGSSVAGGGLGVYGDGSDGSPTFDGAATILGLVPVANVYTLTRDLFLASPTINNGVTIIPNGFRFLAAGTWTNNGTLQWNGNNGSAASGGAQVSNTSASTISTAAIGSSGGSGATGVGGNGTAAATAISYGGQGGHGGSGTSAAGGTGGTLTALPAKVAPLRFVPLAIVGIGVSGDGTVSTSFRTAGGTGGGAGGGDGTNSGGGGGSGGGLVLVAARAIAGTGSIQARGGGGVTPAGGNTGGGGGGGGGLVVVVSGSISGGAISGQTIDANGGAHGSAHGTGPNAGVTDGSAGTVILIPN